MSQNVRLYKCYYTQKEMYVTAFVGHDMYLRNNFKKNWYQLTIESEYYLMNPLEIEYMISEIEYIIKNYEILSHNKDDWYYKYQFIDFKQNSIKFTFYINNDKVSNEIYQNLWLKIEINETVYVRLSYYQILDFLWILQGRKYYVISATNDDMYPPKIIDYKGDVIGEEN